MASKRVKFVGKDANDVAVTLDGILTWEGPEVGGGPADEVDLPERPGQGLPDRPTIPPGETKPIIPPRPKR